MTHDTNEALVKHYFELQDYFVKTNIKYLRKKEETGKKTSARSDLDLIVYNPKTGDKALVGVSAWHNQRITPSLIKTSGYRLFGFLNELALREAKKVLDTDDFRKILVVSRLGAKKESQDKFKQEAYAQGVDEIIEFTTVIRKIVDRLDTGPSQDDEALELLRIMKLYDMIKEE